VPFDLRRYPGSAYRLLEKRVLSNKTMSFSSTRLSRVDWEVEIVHVVPVDAESKREWESHTH